MQENGEEITDEERDDWYLRKLNAGLAHLQNIDYVLAWVVMEDDGVRNSSSWVARFDRLTSPSQAQNHSKMLLSRKGNTFKDIIEVLKGMTPEILAVVD
jgi:beta-catenin-like protein 1